MSFSTVQGLVGLIAGILSIAGTLVAVPKFFAPAAGTGQVVAVVHEAKTEKAVTGATIEILTLENALITTLKPNDRGKARYSLEEGRYRIRVSHPSFAVEVRQVHIVSGQTAEVRLPLRTGASSPLRHVERVIDEGVGVVRRVFAQ